MPDQIKVEGIIELRKALKDLGDVDASREYKAAGFAAAAEVVIPRAKGRAAGLGRMEARAAETLYPAKTVTGGAVRFGAGFSGAFGAEFGAMRNQRRARSTGSYTGLKQFRPWRGSSGDAGYFLWPTIRDDADQIVDRFEKGIEPLKRRLFPEGGA